MTDPKLFAFNHSVDPSKGGIQRYSHEVLTYLVHKGAFIALNTLDGSSVDGCESLRHIKLIDRMLLQRRLIRFLSRRQIDLILCFHLHLVPKIFEVCKALNIQFDVFLHGIESWVDRLEKHAEFLQFMRYAYPVSTFTKEQARRQGVDERRMKVVPPVINLERFENVSHERTTTSSIRFVTVGRLDSQEQYKGHDFVIEAINRVLAEVSDVEYWIVGDGDDKVRLEGKVETLGLSNHVKFLGFVPDSELPRVYSEADVFIMPSRVSLDADRPTGEGFGIVFLEAAACKLPLIGPNIGGPTDIIHDEYNGYAVDPDSVDDIADAMCRIIRNDSAREEMGNNAYNMVHRWFTTDNLTYYLGHLIN